MTDKKKMDRQTLGVLLALGFGLVIVGAVLFITLSAGDSGDPSAPSIVIADPQQSQPQQPQQTDPSTGPVFNLAAKLPPGDYGPYCAELVRQGVSAEGASSIVGIKALFDRINFDALIAAAPEGIRPDLEAVAGVRADVVALLAPAQDFGDIDPAAYPPAFVKSMPVLVSAAGKCKIPD